MSPKSSTSGQISSIKIIGSGLIGTSIGLALAKNGVKVEMADIDPNAARLANDLMASEPDNTPEIILYAGPSSGLIAALESEFKVNPKSKFIDIGSVKTKSLLEVSRSSIPIDNSWLHIQWLVARSGERNLLEPISSNLEVGFIWIPI